MIITCTSKPEFTAKVFGIINNASAYAATPKRAFPFTVSLNLSNSLLTNTSNAPAPREYYRRS